MKFEDIDWSADPASLLPAGESLPRGNGRWKVPVTKDEWDYLEGQMMNSVSDGWMTFDDMEKYNMASLIAAGNGIWYAKDKNARLMVFNIKAGVIGAKGADSVKAVEKILESVCRKHKKTIREMALEYQRRDLIVSLIEDNLPLQKICMPSPLSLLGKASRVYSHVFKHYKPMAQICRGLWDAQMQEEIEDPERYGQVSEDQNPLGIEIGDVVRVARPDFGNYTGFVTTISAEDDGDFRVCLQTPGDYGGGGSMTRVLSVNGKPVAWKFTPKEKAPEFEAPRGADIKGQLMLFGGS
jgi:hypothetical protein